MNRTAILPIEAAKKLAKSLSSPFVEGFLRGVAELENAGVDVVQIAAAMTEDGSYDITVTEPSGVIVGWFLDEWEASAIAFPGGEPAEDLHVTLAYLGEAADLTTEQQRTLIGVTSEVAQRHRELEGHIGGVGRFSNGQETDPFWVGVDIPGLAELRADLVEALTIAGIPLQGFAANKPYTPHITVAYIPSEADNPPLTVRQMSVRVRDLTVAIGGRRHQLGLQPVFEDGPMTDGPHMWVPDLVTKSAETVKADRFTLGPWYVPNQADAHGDWTDPQEIQKALWGYVKTDDRRIRLQHNTDIVAGEWLEAVTWPFEVEVPLTKADGTVTKYKYPAGTPFLGVQWEPWAWELVTSGELRGFSIGGTGDMVLADLPES
jgi:2'-5' RNA ligase